jgi:uncharacterized membrane protein
MYDEERLTASGVALVATLCMIPIETRLRGRIGGEAFKKLIVVLLAFSCVSLIVRAAGL